MKEHFSSFFKRLRGWFVLAAAVICFAGGAYLILLTLAPSVQLPFIMTDVPGRVEKLLATTKPGVADDRLYIPQLNVDVAIVTGTNVSVLDKGAWHRNPQNGDPVQGGNFVLSAHRFAMGLTPQQTRVKSPFYRIDTLAIGDRFFVDYQGKRYAYIVARRYEVPRTAIEVEGPSQQAKLTLYSCDLRGEKAGRYVIEAAPQGEVR